MMIDTSALAGDRRALARLLTQVENDTKEGREALRALFPQTGRAHLIGITGAPGTGKSSLASRLALAYRNQGKRVAIAAIDPSSPFSGGAVLGDRIRMQALSGDPGVFIRSMASRGALGGLARATAGMVQVFDAAGFDKILIETVGTGQAEVDIARLAHTILVVEAPGLGDDIQAIKAGILEIADILVVNKADRPGAGNTERALRSAVDLAYPSPKTAAHHGLSEAPPPASPSPGAAWSIPIQQTISTDGTGIVALVEHVERHLEFLKKSGHWTHREGARLTSEVEALLQRELLLQMHADLPEGRYNELIQRVLDRKMAPEDAVRELLHADGREGQAAKDG